MYPSHQVFVILVYFIHCKYRAFRIEEHTEGLLVGEDDLCEGVVKDYDSCLQTIEDFPHVFLVLVSTKVHVRESNLP